MDAPLAARGEFEMLDRVGDIDARAVDPRLAQRPVEHLPGRTYERLAGEILLIAGLLADEHDLGVDRPLAEHRPRRAFVEAAAGALRRFVARRLPRLG